MYVSTLCFCSGIESRPCIVLTTMDTGLRTPSPCGQSPY